MATAPLPNSRELLRTGQEHYRAQQFDEAIEVLSKVANDDPAVFAQALAVIGRCHTRKGNYEQAHQALNLSNKMAPSPLTDYFIGECYYHQGDYVSAEERLDTAVAQDNKITDAYILLGTIRRNAGNLDGAILAYNLALRNDPKAIAARFQLAQAAYDLGDLQRATSQAFMIVQQKEDFAPVHLLLGHCALRLNDFRQAAYEYCRVLQLSEPTLEIYEGLGRAFANLKDFEQALKAFEAVITLDPDHEMSYVAGARLAERMGDTERAKRFWTEATRFPKYTQMATDSLAKLGAEAPPEPAAATKKGKGPKGAKPVPPKPVATVLELPRDFVPPQQIDRSAIPQQRTNSMPTAPLTTHAAGTLSLASRQPAKTEPLRPVAPPPAYEEEKPSLKAAFSLDGLLNSAAGVFSSWMAKAKKPAELSYGGGGSGETVADIIAKRAQERAAAAAPSPEEPAEVPPKPKGTKPAGKPGARPKR